MMLNTEFVTNAHIRIARYYTQKVIELSNIYSQGGVNIYYALETFDADRTQLEQSLSWLEQHATLDKEIGTLFLELMTAGNQIFSSRLLPNRCLALYEQALSIAKQHNDIDAILKSLTVIASVYYKLSLPDQHYQALQEGCKLAEAADKKAELADFLESLARYYLNLGQYEPALNVINQSYEIYRLLKDAQSQGSSLLLLGTTFLFMGEWDKADHYLQASYTIAKRYDDQKQILLLLQEIGELRYRLGQFQISIDYRLDALQMANQLGNQVVKIQTLMDLGSCYMSLKDWDTADHYFIQALKTTEETGIKLYEGTILLHYGESAYRQGKYETAQQLMENALQIIHQEQSQKIESTGLAIITMVYFALERFTMAYQAFYKGLQLAIEVENQQLYIWQIITAVELWVATANRLSNTEHQQELLSDAVKWCGLIYQSSYAEKQNQDKVDELLPQLEEQLGKEQVVELLKQGKKLTVDMVISDIFKTKDLISVS